MSKKEFEKARDEANADYDLYYKEGFDDGANWAYEWFMGRADSCGELSGTNLHCENIILQAKVDNLQFANQKLAEALTAIVALKKDGLTAGLVDAIAEQALAEYRGEK